ncbi:MAG TPA: hypothetical protein VFT19_11250 [Solirubrobacterales bacterium]|nr:hypothetical protein [Solirubrobacterales bacterium]
MRRTVVEPTSSLRSEALTIALATLTVALLVIVAFWHRLDEFRIGSVSFKLLDAMRVRRIRQRTDDSDKALEALELYLRKMDEAVEEGRPVDKKLADDATDAAVAEVQAELARHVSVVDSEPPQIQIEGAPSESEARWATSEFQYLPAGLFPADLIAEIQGRPAGHRIYVLERVDVLAAISYEAAPETPLLLHAIATRTGGGKDDRGSAVAAAVLATRYLHAVAKALGRPPGLVIATDHGDADRETLQALGFRPARREETWALPPGEYWMQKLPDVPEG